MFGTKHMRKVFYKEKKRENEKLLKTCLRVAISILFIDDRPYQRDVMRATSNKWLQSRMKSLCFAEEIFITGKWLEKELIFV